MGDYSTEQVWLALTLLVVICIATILVLSIGFSRIPARSFRIWATGFLVASVGRFVETTGTANDDPLVVNLGAVGLVVFAWLIWAGLRAERTRSLRSVAIAVGVGILSAAVGVLVPTDYGGALVDLFVAVGALAIFFELRARRARLAPATVLSIATLIVFVLSVLEVTAWRVLSETSTTQLSISARASWAIEAGFVMTVAVVLLVGIDAATDADRPGNDLQQRARGADRLRRAEQRGEVWSVVELALDDMAALTATGGQWRADTAVERLTRVAVEQLPSTADIVPGADGRLCVLLPGTGVVAREHVRAILNHFASADGLREVGVLVSVSAGITDVETDGYDLEQLETSARAALAEAQQAGGNRWTRVRVGGDHEQS